MPEQMEESLRKAFKDRYGCEAEYMVRCPGRVNLIGEHIDYSGFGVLPMAIDAATYVLVSSNETNEITFTNTDAQYPPKVHQISEKWVGLGKPQWHHYFLCGWKGMLERLNVPSKGIYVLLSGSIPPSSGLSSSSSIVCASALATLALHTGKTWEVIGKEELAEMCAKIEHYIGTEGGGMDQAVEILAESGSALMIDFGPLRHVTVRLPQGALFAVLHSGATHNKAASSHYNERVVECRIAAQIIAKKRGLAQWKSIRTLGQLSDALGKAPAEMLPVVEADLDAPLYTRDAVLAALALDNEQFATLSLSANTQHMDEFKLSQRARHVFSEAARVRDFRDACEADNARRMGALMNQSHASCRDLFECSCNELDDTVEKCLSKGALGARLTGAGWGGCVVALFDRKQAELEPLFWSEPSGGIQIFRLQF